MTVDGLLSNGHQCWFAQNNGLCEVFWESQWFGIQSFFSLLPSLAFSNVLLTTRIVLHSHNFLSSLKELLLFHSELEGRIDNVRETAWGYKKILFYCCEDSFSCTSKSVYLKRYMRTQGWGGHENTRMWATKVKFFTPGNMFFFTFHSFRNSSAFIIQN